MNGDLVMNAAGEPGAVEAVFDYLSYLQYAPYAVSAVAGLWLVNKLIKWMSGPAALVSGAFKRATPMAACVTGGVIGPLGAAAMEPTFGGHGVVSAYVGMGLVMAFALVTQLRNWCGAVSKENVSTAIAKLKSAKEVKSETDKDIWIDRALHSLDHST